MAEPKPFKDLVNPASVRQLAGAFVASSPGFAAGDFVRDACAGLGALELKGRIQHVARSLRPYLSEDVPQALAQIVATLPPPLSAGQPVTAEFMIWPLTELVEQIGLEHPDESLGALYELTRRFTAEFAVRPFLERYPERTLPLLRTWTRDADPHVRRLVSEGTRPRLPWGRRLRSFVEDPSPVLELLELLKDDPAEYVRRSVANNLNDIAKDHPELAVQVAAAWWEGASKERQRLVRHALRTLVKQGDSGALAVLGYGLPEVELVAFEASPAVARVGGSLELSLTLKSTGTAPQQLVVDYAVLHRRANGGTSAKVFKWTTRTLAPKAAVTLTKRHSLRKVTTRRYYAGEHGLRVQVNGRELGATSFELEVGPPQTGEAPAS